MTAQAPRDGAPREDLAGILTMLAGGMPEPAHERIALALHRALTLRVFTDDRLPSERWLAEAFGVSRITIRQAVALLREQGMVHPGGSTRAGMRLVPRTWAHAISPGLLEDARRDIADILAFRAVIEPVIARLAAVRADAALAARLDASIAVLRADPDPDAYRRADSEFHLALAQACGNTRLLGAVLVSRADLLRWRDLLPMPDDVAENLRDHERIAAAVTAGHDEAAAAAMEAHLLGTLDAFEANVRLMAATVAGDAAS